MSDKLHFPRLDVYRAAAEWSVARTLDLTSISEQMRSVDLSTADFYHTGKRARLDDVLHLRDEVTRIAHDHGFPNRSQGRKDLGTAFDRAVAATIHKLCPISPSEAARSDIWTFINIRILLDILVWRWGTQSSEKEWYVSEDRLFQLARTAFGRLWWRIELLGPGPTVLLSEDQSVQLMERTRVSSYPPLARCIAERLIADSSEINKDDLLRVFMKRLGRRMAVSSMFVMHPDELAEFVDHLFVESAEALFDAGS